jgi:putative transcriptional regulator
MEKDKYSPTLELAFKIARAFAVPIGEVFSYEPVQD